MMSETRESYEKWESWKHNTPKFAHDVFAFKPDNWQLEAFQAWDNPAIDRIAMQACAGPGKTAVEAICAWQFLVCRSDGINHPQAFAMSITGDNLRDNLWKELAIWYGRSQFLRTSLTRVVRYRRQSVGVRSRGYRTVSGARFSWRATRARTMVCSISPRIPKVICGR
jgi:hypothetical protein